MKNYWLIPVMALNFFLVVGCAPGMSPAENPMGFALSIMGIPAPFQTGIGEVRTDENTKATVKDYPKNMQETWNACLASAGDMKLNISSQKFDSQGSLLEATDPAVSILKPEFKVRVELVSKGEQSTTVMVSFIDPGGRNWFNAGTLDACQKEFHQYIMTHCGQEKTWEIH
jgi:hypothetical protein